MIRIYTTILVNCIALSLTASGIVTAQETAIASVPIETMTAAAPTTASESLNETTHYGDMAGDRAVRIVSAEYVDGTAVLVLGLDLSWTITVTAPTGSTSADAVARNLVRRPIPPGWTMIRIDSPEPWVILVTSYFVENGRYTETRPDDGNSALIASPFTGTDVRDAAIGGALGASLDALLVVTRRHLGLRRGMERVA